MTDSQNFVTKWYIIHTYSGYEKKVKTDLEKRIDNLNLGDRVFRIAVPEEENVEMRRGKEKLVSKKLFPGYVVVEMLVEKEEGLDGIAYKVDSEAWYVIRNTAGVTGFVGVGSEPIPLEDEEVANLLKHMGIKDETKTVELKLNYKVGDLVSIIEGPFEGSEGKVTLVDLEHKKIEVMVEMFGRQTPVEIDVFGVEKVEA